MALESRHKPLTVQPALAKLRDSSVVIDRRGDFNKEERKRAVEAEIVLERGQPAPGSRGEKNRTKYWKFLQKVNELSGRAMVLLSAVALGLSAIGNMRERVRIDLPYEINALKETLLNPTLLRLAHPDGVPVPTDDPALQSRLTARPPKEQSR
ncbi:uncharacterized protein BDV17DRAFT_244390 [Aspergillus undulatus]|uniref:uncharacterized protein n=1 Tax=Aspergillus undulatus TaxID=1810928 RepID=UPI003CCDB7E9